MFRSGFPGWYAIDSIFTVASSTSRRNSIANKNKKLAERERFLPVLAIYRRTERNAQANFCLYSIASRRQRDRSLFRFSQARHFNSF